MNRRKSPSNAPTARQPGSSTVARRCGLAGARREPADRGNEHTHHRAAGRDHGPAGRAKELPSLRVRLAAVDLRNGRRIPEEDHWKDECRARRHSVCVVCVEFVAAMDFSDRAPQARKSVLYGRHLRMPMCVQVVSVPASRCNSSQGRCQLRCTALPSLQFVAARQLGLQSRGRRFDSCPAHQGRRSYPGWSSRCLPLASSIASRTVSARPRSHCSSKVASPT